jgi:hypothetical protein
MGFPLRAKHQVVLNYSIACLGIRIIRLVSSSRPALLNEPLSRRIMGPFDGNIPAQRFQPSRFLSSIYTRLIPLSFGLEILTPGSDLFR